MKSPLLFSSFSLQGDLGPEGPAGKAGADGTQVCANMYVRTYVGTVIMTSLCLPPSGGLAVR